ncbi:hypothetical protein ASE08_07060 [Rhizobacter sp. Root16D2]|nr:hypothetical protein ASE08_07060 [Rhizobacter sp. Root16D2]
MLIMNLFVKSIFISALFSSYEACALDASDFSELEGWTVSAVTAVKGQFEGCEHGKRIRFENGMSLVCDSYSYMYAYQPDAVIFTKGVTLKGRSYVLIKVLIDDEFFDMHIVAVK